MERVSASSCCVVIAAYNEAPRVGAVVLAALQAFESVCVVDDGSGDGTALAARAVGARVVQLPRNSGKAAAMEAGVRAAGEPGAILFCDADVTLTPQTLLRVAAPVLAGTRDMCIGCHKQHTGGRRVCKFNSCSADGTPRSFAGVFSGLRCVSLPLWRAVHPSLKHGYNIELGLNFTAKHGGGWRRTKHIPVPYTHVSKGDKEDKRGWLLSAARMNARLVGAYVRAHMLLAPPGVRARWWVGAGVVLLGVGVALRGVRRRRGKPKVRAN